MTELDIRLDDADLAELCGAAPVALERFVPDWEVRREEICQHAMTAAAPSRRPRALAAVAAAAVVVALGAGLAWAGPAAQQPAVAQTLACGHHTAPGVRAPGARLVFEEHADVLQLAVTGLGMESGATVHLQLLDARGRVVSQPLATRHDGDELTATVTADDLCGTSTLDALRHTSLQVRVVVERPGRERRCLLVRTAAATRC